MLGDSSPREAWIRDALFDDCSPIIHAIESYAGVPRGGFVQWFRQRYREFSTSAGRCDLVIDCGATAIVVEVKRDVANEDAVAQCLRYMGALAYDRIGSGSIGADDVYGVIVAPQIARNAALAAYAAGIVVLRAVPQVLIMAVDNPITLARDEQDTRVSESRDAHVEKSPLSVLPGALEGGDRAATLLGGGSRIVDRHDVRDA